MENTRTLTFIENAIDSLCHIVYSNEVEKVGNDLRIAKEYRGRVTKVTSGNFHLGARFENMAQNKERNFDVQPMQECKGMHVYAKCPRYVRESDYKPNYLYLVMPLSSMTHCTNEYYLDGVAIDFEDLIKCGALVEVKHRVGYVEPPKNYYRVIKFENIIELKQTDLNA